MRATSIRFCFFYVLVRVCSRFRSLVSRTTNSRPGSVLPLLLLLPLLLMSACAPPSSPSGSEQAGTSPNGLPELTDEIIHERINEAHVREVPEENGTGDPIFWNFDHNEPKEIRVVEKQMNGTRATIVLDIKTRSAPGVRNPRQLSGQIRTKWQLQTGWVLRRWEIIDTENISMKYKNLPKPTPPALPANFKAEG